jgi:hypothetical protein
MKFHFNEQYFYVGLYKSVGPIEFRPWLNVFENYPDYMRAYTRMFDRVYIRIRPPYDGTTWQLE